MVSPCAFARAPCDVRADRNQEEIHMRSTSPDRLLLDTSDREHGTVERELARRGHAAAMGHVAAELACDLESERETGRRPADLAEVDAHVERGARILASWSTRMPMIARLVSAGFATVRTEHV